jgi:glycerophosphoryl diester phosphodiesterase
MAYVSKDHPALDADGKPFVPALADVDSVTPKDLIKAAHSRGLFVHTYTFRDEARYLPRIYQDDPRQEYLPFWRAGIDGVFTDFANTGVDARNLYFKELGFY